MKKNKLKLGGLGTMWLNRPGPRIVMFSLMAFKSMVKDKCREAQHITTQPLTLANHYYKLTKSIYKLYTYMY